MIRRSERRKLAALTQEYQDESGETSIPDKEDVGSEVQEAVSSKSPTDIADQGNFPYMGKATASGMFIFSQTTTSILP